MSKPWSGSTMSKRAAEDAHAPLLKKQKFDRKHQATIEPSKIQSASQLHGLLRFHQDASPQLESGIRSFKLFLESITYAEQKLSTLKQQAILKEYLDSHTSELAQDTEPTFLPDILQAWGYANQSHNERLLTAVPAILALLLKTISSLIDFRDHGILLCKVLLQQPQLKYISSGLNAPSHKERVISPCLRLLTEITSFDGGAFAHNVLGAKSVVFDPRTISKCLSMWKVTSGNQTRNTSAPSVRANTLRFVIALLKFSTGSAKNELLKYSQVWKVLFEHMSKDHADTTRDVLDAVKTHVLLNESVTRRHKSYLFIERNLSSIANLYRLHDQPEDDSNPEYITSKTLAHNFLLVACTNPIAGVLQASSGWYPPGTNRDTLESNLENISQEFASSIGTSEKLNGYKGRSSVRNNHLANFAQSLRPFASTLESELLLAIFKAAPELVSDYFSKKAGFAFDPKLTSTWIGYSSFLFSSIQLPVPAFFGRSNEYGSIPPPISIVLENIMPQPLTQKVLTRCLNQQIDLITFFAIRITTVAFQKLEWIISRFKQAAKQENLLWDESIQALTAQFAQRCPKMKDVIATFRSTPKANFMQREAILRLLTKYYEIIPFIALEENFDVAVPLANALNELDATILNPEKDKDNELETKLVELNHLVQISRWSPSMDWWQRPKSLSFSPFVVLLKLFAAQRHIMPVEIYHLLRTITIDCEILQTQTNCPAIHALVASLSSSTNWAPSESVYLFIDDCLTRLKRPIKYEEDLEKLSSSAKGGGFVSILHMVLIEQWPFAFARDGRESIAQWLARYVQACKAIGEDEAVLNIVLDGFVTACKDETGWFQLYPEDLDALSSVWEELNALHPLSASNKVIERTLDSKIESPTALEEKTNVDGEEDPATLHVWSSQDIVTAISSGAVTSLINHLASNYPEIRTQALTQLHMVLNRLFTPQVQSSLPEWRQIHLLIQELIATTRTMILAQEPVPHLVTSFAANFLDVLADPLDPLYEKVNRFLMRGPSWDVTRLASYWITKTLSSPPLEDFSTTSSHVADPIPKSYLPLNASGTHNPHWAEVAFLLSAISRGLRTPVDLELLRAKGSFEPLMALAWDPSLPKSLLTSVIDIVEKAAVVEGGAGTATTRAGAVAWVGMLESVLSTAVRGGGRGGRYEETNATVQRLKRLKMRLWDGCEKERVGVWSAGMMETVVKR